MRIGVLGGTFDPIHLGHLLIAEEVRQRLNLTKVIFVPAGQPRLRPEEAHAPATDRLRMVELATADNPLFETCSAEVQRNGPTYTVDTLAELRRVLGPAACLHFIVGVDILGKFHLWKDPNRILELCKVVVVARSGGEDFDWPEWYAQFPRAEDRVTRLVTPLMDVSGTGIRRKVGQGEELRYLVPEAVADYIREHRLYLD